jgi:hypothetical protein
LRSRSSYFVSESGNLLRLAVKSTLLNPTVAGDRCTRLCLLINQVPVRGCAGNPLFEKKKDGGPICYFSVKAAICPTKIPVAQLQQKDDQRMEAGSEAVFAAIVLHHKEDLCRVLEANRVKGGA